MQPWELDAQPLPFTTPPVAGETTTSYLGRLAEINNWSKDALLDLIAAHRPPNNPTQHDWTRYDLVLNYAAINRVATISGNRPETLGRALSFGCRLPADGSAQPVGTWHLVLAASPTRQIPVAACPRCIAAKAIRTPPLVYLPVDQPFCPRHWLWLTDQPHGQPINLTSHPELLRAAKHHLRLRAKRGAQPTAAAATTATRLWFRYRRGAAVPNHLQQRWIDRHATLTPDLRGHVLITRYSEIITLTAMITSPYWITALMRPYNPPRSNRRWIPRTRPDERDFYIELARRLRLPDNDRFSINPGALKNWTIHTRQKAHVV